MERGESMRQGFKGGNEVFKMDLRRGISMDSKIIEKNVGGIQGYYLVVRHGIKLGS